MNSRKLLFASKVQEFCTQVIGNHIKGYDARDIFNDRGYPPGEGDPIIDADVASLEIKAIDVTNAMVFFENFCKMLDGQQITVADYRSSLNKMRTDL